MQIQIGVCISPFVQVLLFLMQYCIPNQAKKLEQKGQKVSDTQNTGEYLQNRPGGASVDLPRSGKTICCISEVKEAPLIRYLKDSKTRLFLVFNFDIAINNPSTPPQKSANKTAPAGVVRPPFRAAPEMSNK